jgi:hypothetical protein
MNEPAPTDLALARQLGRLEQWIWWLGAACLALVLINLVHSSYLTAHEEDLVAIVRKINALSYCLTHTPGFEKSGCTLDPAMEGKQFPLDKGYVLSAVRKQPTKEKEL